MPWRLRVRYTSGLRAWLAFVGLCLVSIVTCSAAQSAPTVHGSGSGFLLVQLSNTSVYQAALVEQALTTELLARFPTAPSVQCVDMRDTAATTPDATTTTSSSADTTRRLDLLFLVGDNPLLTNASTPAPAELSVNVTALQDELALALATLVPSVGLSLRTLPNATAFASYGPLPWLASATAPASGTAFLRVDMSFRNLLAPSNLTQSLLFQTRRGIQRFLGLTSLAQVTATGPPHVPASSVLLLTQSFWVVLNNNATDATRENRQRLANLLIYGDPTRLVVDRDAGVDAPPRPAMFLDFAVDPTEPLSPDPTVLLTLPYVFSSLSVDEFPVGNPPAPVVELPPGTTVIPATPTDQLLARVRKRHVFQFVLPVNATDTVANAGGSACPASSVAGGGSTGLCVTLQWNNTLDDMPFWLESIESVDALAWNMAPGVVFCGAHETPTPLLASPSVPTGQSAVVWAFARAPTTPTTPTTAPTRIAFALNLRSRDDNATRVQVEIAADMRSTHQAATTVTSIARRVAIVDPDAADDETPVPLPPVYATRSNVVVAFDSQFKAASSEIALSLTLQAGDVTHKDTSQPCAHCQNLYEWCAAHAACHAIANCVFRDGLEATQVPATLLQRPTLGDDDSVVDVSPLVRQCLATAALDALLLFASAVRCQLQRQCAVRTPAAYGLTGLDDRLLLWEATDGVLQLPLPPVNANATATVNTSASVVTLRLLDTPLCSFTPAAFATPSVASTTELLEDFVARHCAHANHLGRVSLTSVTTTNANTTALELRFQDLVGPLPTVETPDSAQAAVVTALPTLKLRLERTDFATALPPLPLSPPLTDAQICRTTCRTLALDRCLRDLECIAFTDCITRAPAGNGSTETAETETETVAETVGDALLQLFERRVVGESLSLRDAVDRCAPRTIDTNDSATASATRAWHTLVAASACHAKHDCALSLQGVVLPPAPDGDAVVGTWRFAPSPLATQRLLYEQQPDDTAVAPYVPLAVAAADAVPFSDNDDNADNDAVVARRLARVLRQALQFDDINVTLVTNTTTADDGTGGDGSLRRVQWEITYAYWLGPLPRVVDASLAPRWRLVDMPRDEPLDVVVEMVARNSSSSSTTSASSSDATTMHVVEMAAATTVSG